MENSEHVKEATNEDEVSEAEVTWDKEAARNVEEPTEELLEANIDAKVGATKWEQEDLVSMIPVQKKLHMPDALDHENRRLRDELPRAESESEPAACPGWVTATELGGKQRS